MSIANLYRVLRIFRGNSLEPEERDELVKEALLMILSRATITDTNINAVEVATVQRIFKQKTGEDIEEKDVRVTAISKLYEDASFDRFVAKVSAVLELDDRRMIADALAEVIKADENVAPLEVDFFNQIIKDLGLQHSDVAGLST